MIQGLHDRKQAARAQFRTWLQEPVQRLMGDLLARHQLQLDLTRLTEHALHSAETYLRARPIESFDTVSWRALRAEVLLQLAKQAHQPFGGAMGNGFNPAPLPSNDQYSFRTLFMPYEKVGSFWYGGDWYGGMQTPDGSLWVIVADVTGHGYYAYLLATTLPGIWEQCWSRASIPTHPHAILDAMHRLLSDCLPDGMFVECTLLRLEPNGKVTVAPAGATRFLLRSGSGDVDLVKLRGLWLGLDPPSVEDQYVVVLGDGDELVFGSDGVFDQLGGYADASPNLVDRLKRAAGRGTLLDVVEQALREDLKRQSQKDDFTLVLVRRHNHNAELSVAKTVP